jgi:hypothetical protein
MLNLQDKNMKELRQIAKQIGLPGVKAESMEQLRARIVITMEPGVIDALSIPDVNPVQLKRKEVVPDPANTPEAVMKALEPFKGKINLAFYDDEGNITTEGATTWAVKNGPAEDSGSLTVPLKWILFKASEIANARFPAVINDPGFDKVRNIPLLA